MATKHSKAAKQFQQNAQRAEWHDNTLWGVRVKRDRMSRSLPEWEQLRDMASAIKKHTLSHLDSYLEQFAEIITLVENWCIFVASAIILMLISTATVLIYTIRAARTNPVDVLKKE